MLTPPMADATFLFFHMDEETQYMRIYASYPSFFPNLVFQTRLQAVVPGRAPLLHASVVVRGRPADDVPFTAGLGFSARELGATDEDRSGRRRPLDYGFQFAWDNKLRLGSRQ